MAANDALTKAEYAMRHQEGAINVLENVLKEQKAKLKLLKEEFKKQKAKVAAEKAAAAKLKVQKKESEAKKAAAAKLKEQKKEAESKENEQNKNEGNKPKNLTVLEYAKQVIKQRHNKPMTPKMIYSCMIKNNYNPFTTKTPEASIHTTLTRDRFITKIRMNDDSGKYRDHFKICD